MQRFRYTLTAALLLVLVLALGVGFCAAAKKSKGTAPQVVIRNNTDWKDTEGNPIGAHDGGISRFGDTFYWYGCYSHRSRPKRRLLKSKQPSKGFAVYSSDDLVNWKHEGMAMARPKWGWCAEKFPIHRAHVIYNDKTKKYVMWFFYLIRYPGSFLMVAVSDTPTGPFKLLGPQETGGPYGFGQDMDLFKDADGTAYLLYDDGLRNLRIDKLADDYLSSTKESVIALHTVKTETFYGHESPTMIKYKGKYIVAGSGVDGWNPTDTDYAVADKPMGPYGKKKRMSKEKTWGSQITDLVYLKENDTIFAMCDSWFNPDPNDLNKSRYYFVPVSFDANSETATMHYSEEPWNPWE